MQTVLQLQMLPAFGTGMECVSNISCESYSSCDSETSCFSMQSHNGPVELEWSL